jgi:hypothetical protein
MNQHEAARSLSRPKQIVLVVLLLGLGVLGVITAATGHVWTALAVSSGTIVWLLFVGAGFAGSRLRR